MTDYLKNMIGHWDLSEINSQNIAHRTQGSHNGTGVNLAASNLVDGVGGGVGTSFNGVDESVRISSDSELQPSSYTIACAVKFDTVNNDEYMLSYGDTSSDGFSFGILSGNFAVIHGGTGLKNSGFSPTVGQWHIAIAVYNSTDLTVDFYIDSDRKTQGTSLSNYTAPSTDAYIAMRGQGTNFMDATIDSMLFFNTNITEIQAYDLTQNMMRGLL